ncbi:MAG: hypothetical protein IKK43_04435 [Clostridia bacterium]|nr:hypothetical protein [Clostridia bacterium]
MKEFSFRFVAEEGIKVDFIQASPTEVVFRVYRDDATTAEPNVNVSKKDNTVVEIREEAASEAPKKSTRKRIDKELFEKLWNEGVSAETMADQLGVTKNSVYNYAYKNGYGRRKAFKRIGAKQLIPDKLAGKLERFVQMWNDCLPIADIATEFEVSIATVCRWASKIPECSSSEEKKQKRASMKQMATVTTDGNTSRPSAEPISQSKMSSKEDWPKTGERLRENEIKALCDMWHNGQRNVTELARYFGVSKNAIYYQLRVNGCRGK